MRGKTKNGRMSGNGRMRQSKKHKDIKGSSSGCSSSNGGGGSGCSSNGGGGSGCSSNGGGGSGSSSNVGGGGGFYGCYLLTSLSPRYKGHTYIGYTVNPKRRIRQHNGDICSGASTTKKKRPWDMILCIHGFPSSTAALQFEWAWQHPRESIAVREAVASFKSMGGVANKIKLALTMLTLPSWLPLNLTVSFFSTKYMNHTAGAPPHLNLHFCSIDELPCYSLSPLLHGDNHTHLHDNANHHIQAQTHYHHLHVDDNANHHIPSQAQARAQTHYHLVVDDDDTDDNIHPRSPPSPHQLHDATHSQLTTLKPHSTLSVHQHMSLNMDNNTQQTYHHPPSTPSHISSTHHTQFIDLLTPSPNTTIIRGTKNQKPPSTSPHIIDLTTSPLFIQL